MTTSYLKLSFIVTFLTVFISYLAFVTLLMNRELVSETLNGSFSMTYKMRIVVSLLEGMWTSMSGWGLFLLITTSLLTGVNMSLLLRRLQAVKGFRRIDMATTGGSLLGVIGSGCATCGLPILPLVGLTGLVAYLPLRGLEFSYLSIGILMLSTYFLIRNQNQQCAIPAIKGHKHG